MNEQIKKEQGSASINSNNSRDLDTDLDNNLDNNIDNNLNHLFTNLNTPNDLTINNNSESNHSIYYQNDAKSNSHDNYSCNNHENYSDYNSFNNNQQDIPINYQNNSPNNFPDNNYPYNNNNNDNYLDNKNAKNTNQSIPDVNPAEHSGIPKTSIKHLSQKNYQPIIRPNTDSNSIESKIANFKSLFEIKRKNMEYKTICLDISNYTKSGIENGFIKYDRSSKSNQFSTSFSGKMIERASSAQTPHVSDDKSDNLIFSKSLSIENYKKTIDLEMKLKLNQMKQLYLAHFYKKVPTSFNVDYLVDQINCYMTNDCISLAHLHGLSITDEDGHFMPTVLTDRPVNGPLSLLFETMKNNQRKEGQNNRSDSFNIGTIRSINSEQKFAMICGITRALSFIHSNHFIHSNLNPATVYLNQDLFPFVCDYIFIPACKVTTLYDDTNCGDDSDEDEEEEEKELYSFQFTQETSSDSFQSNIYAAPEMKNCEMIKSSADIYSLGLIIYLILTEQEAKPFDNENSLVYPEGFSETWKNLIKRCVSADPSKRPTASKILEEELFDKEKMPKYISSIHPNSSNEISISELTNSYLILLKNDSNVVFNIFNKMIPNVAEIDYETKLILMAAEKGDARSIDKVGDFFCYGKNNLHRDECWAYLCYAEASKRGNPHSSFIAAQFNEKGVGIPVNLNAAIFYYRRALDQIRKADPKIESKINYLEELNTTLIASHIPANIKTEEIKNMFSNFDVDVKIVLSKEHQQHSENQQQHSENQHQHSEHKQQHLENQQQHTEHKQQQHSENQQHLEKDHINPEQEQKMKIKFKNNEELSLALEDYRNNKQNYSIDNKVIKLGIPYQNKVMIESHRYKSLLPSIYIKIDDYYPKIENNMPIKIGEGSFAATYLVYKKGSPEIYAAKIYQKPLVALQVNLLKREVLMSSRLNHPCILKYIGFCEHSLLQHYNKQTTREILPTLIMEYIPNNTLEYAIKNGNDYFNDTVRLKVIIGIASALNEMFINNIIHRDLKPANILLNKNFEPVICDLGLSRQFTNLMQNQMTDRIGTPIYMAPELINKMNGSIYYKSEVDVYAFGIILFQILTLTKTSHVYPGCKTKKTLLFNLKLNNDYVPNLLDKYKINKIFKKLILSCWNIEKNERPDPMTIYNALIEAVNDPSEKLLPGADIDRVKEYIKDLPHL